MMRLRIAQILFQAVEMIRASRKGVLLGIGCVGCFWLLQVWALRRFAPREYALSDTVVLTSAGVLVVGFAWLMAGLRLTAHPEGVRVVPFLRGAIAQSIVILWVGASALLACILVMPHVFSILALVAMIALIAGGPLSGRWIALAAFVCTGAGVAVFLFANAPSFLFLWVFAAAVLAAAGLIGAAPRAALLLWIPLIILVNHVLDSAGLSLMAALRQVELLQAYWGRCLFAALACIGCVILGVLNVNLRLHLTSARSPAKRSTSNNSRVNGTRDHVGKLNFTKFVWLYSFFLNRALSRNVPARKLWPFVLGPVAHWSFAMAWLLFGLAMSIAVISHYSPNKFAFQLYGMLSNIASLPVIVSLYAIRAMMHFSREEQALLQLSPGFAHRNKQNVVFVRWLVEYAAILAVACVAILVLAKLLEMSATNPWPYPIPHYWPTRTATALILLPALLMSNYSRQDKPIPIVTTIVTFVILLELPTVGVMLSQRVMEAEQRYIPFIVFNVPLALLVLGFCWWRFLRLPHVFPVGRLADAVGPNATSWRANLKGWFK